MLNNQLFPLRILMVCMLFLGSCGIEEQSIQFLNWPIIGGTLDNNTAHNAIVAIQENSTLCSGTLISPRVVMTAAHCMENTDLSAYTVYFGDDASGALDPSLKRYITKSRVAAGYNSNIIGVKDLALFRLSSDPPDGVIPIPNLPHRLEITQLDIDKTLVYVGYGKTSDVPDALDYGVKYTMTHNLNWVCINVPGDCSDLDNLATPNTICENQETTGICLGDSGGPALIERSGKTYVAGVSSFVGQDCKSIGCSTKVDVYESFISDFAQNGLGAGCSSPYDCNSGFCVNSVCCESACQGPCMTCNPGGKCRAVQDGTSCSDNLLCNGEEICKSGTCTPGIPLDCDDGNPYTIDSCDQSLGCVHRPLTEKFIGGCSSSSVSTGKDNEDGGDKLLYVATILAIAFIFLAINSKIKQMLPDSRKNGKK